ncbi:MAG: hypothetical protein ACP5H3_03365 [Candidatus Aenigmatarchaeota archaeon]
MKIEIVRKNKLNFKGEKAFVLRGDFYLVDRNSSIPDTEYVEIFVVRTIIDRRGKEVPIVRLEPHIHKFKPKDDSCHVCECGLEESHKFEVLLAEPISEAECRRTVRCSVCGFQTVKETWHSRQYIDNFGSWKCQYCGYTVFKENPLEILKEVNIEEIKNEIKRNKEELENRKIFEKECDLIDEKIEALKQELKFWEETFGETYFTIIYITDWDLYENPIDEINKFYFNPWMAKIYSMKESSFYIRIEKEDMIFLYFPEKDLRIIYLPVDTGDSGRCPLSHNDYKDWGKGLKSGSFIAEVKVKRFPKAVEEEFKQIMEAYDWKNYESYIQEIKKKIQELKEKYNELFEKSRYCEVFTNPKLKKLHEMSDSPVFSPWYYKLDPYNGYFGGINIRYTDFLEVLLEIKKDIEGKHEK